MEPNNYAWKIQRFATIVKKDLNCWYFAVKSIYATVCKCMFRTWSHAFKQYQRDHTCCFSLLIPYSPHYHFLIDIDSRSAWHSWYAIHPQGLLPTINCKVMYPIDNKFQSIASYPTRGSLSREQKERTNERTNSRRSLAHSLTHSLTDWLPDYSIV